MNGWTQNGAQVQDSYAYWLNQSAGAQPVVPMIVPQMPPQGAVQPVFPVGAPMKPPVLVPPQGQGQKQQKAQKQK